MKLPDHPDALPGEQPPRDGLNHCRLFHSAAHLLSRFLLDQMVPRVGFEPTTYRLRSGCSTAELPGQRPVGDRGAYRDELLASNPALAKPFRDINRWSRSWAQFLRGLAIRCRAREASGEGR